MFEIHDKRIGHLKIFNVTEARANFADVLKENDAKVVVTRHGRPAKILIGYDEYLHLLTDSGQQDVASQGELTETLIQGAILESNVPADAVGMPPKWVQQEADQIVTSLRGLLNK